MCVSMMTRENDISNGFKEAVVAAAHQSEKVFRTLVSLLRSGCPSRFTPKSDHAMFREIQ